jgi:hypothetical protein
MPSERDEAEKYAALSKLLEMSVERWPPPWGVLVSELERFGRDQALLDMWPEACRSAGVPLLEFPREIIEEWQKDTGGKQPS